MPELLEHERAECELCFAGFNAVDVTAVVELNDELLVACLGCLAKVLLREIPGRVVHT